MSNETKQTAVDWLYIELAKFQRFESEYKHPREIYNKAREIEKEQMKIAYEDERPLLSHYEEGTAFEAYYKENYGGNK